MSITKATLLDVPEINLLVNSAYRGETSKQGWSSEAHLLDGTRIDEETLYSYFGNPDVTILKNTDENGKITGCVYLEVMAKKLHVGLLSISPKYQNLRTGRELLLEAEKYARQLKCDTLTMTVISVRRELINWFERRGYTYTGERLPFNYGTKYGVQSQPFDLLVMEKPVPKINDDISK